MKRPLPPMHLVLLLTLLAPYALSEIGSEPAAMIEALADQGVAVVAAEQGYLGTMGTNEVGVRFDFDQRGGVVYRVEGSATVATVAGDPAAALMAELVGASTVYRDQLVEPVRTFFETRLGELAGQGEVALGVEEYVLTLTVESVALEGSGPFNVDFGVAFQEIEEARFPVSDHTLGPADARYVIREFSDFQCPFCANFQQTLLPEIKAAIERGEGPWAEVRFEFHHFPLQSIHANALIAAEAAECVAAANAPEAFWEYHDALFERQAAWEGLGDPGAYFARLGQELGLSSAGVESCLAERTYLAAVDGAFRAAAVDLRLTGTPSVFVNGFKVRDYLSLAAYEELFERSDRFAQP